FQCGAFAEDASDRNALLGHAMARVLARGGPKFHPSQVVIVGDTPLDVEVARAGHARSVAVATGSYDREALEKCGADVVLGDLSDLETALGALG
uniref:HAD hydrolase-like protein n=1 Tax=Salmonella sp. SAL4444 TaxID=3159899 RepID=UPI00397BC2B8